MSYRLFCKSALRTIAFVGVLSLPGLALAQPSPAEVRAQARFKAGQELFNKGDFEGARLEFLQAQVIFPRPSLLRSLAACELHMGRSLEALKHLEEFMADPNLAADQRALAEPNFAKAYAATGHVAVTAPNGAHVKVDGTEVGEAPLKDAVDVVVGTHAVDAVLGDGAAHASVQTEAGKVTAVTLSITGAPSVVPGPPVGLLVPPPPPDPNDLRSSYWNSRRTAGAAIVGAGGLALILGGVFAAERASETSDASAAGAKVGAGNSGCSGAGSSSPSCGALANALHSNGSDARLEAIFLVSGAVLIVGGVVTTLWPSSAQSSTTALSPAVGPHGGGLAWTGSF